MGIPHLLRVVMRDPYGLFWSVNNQMFCFSEYITSLSISRLTFVIFLISAIRFLYDCAVEARRRRRRDDDDDDREGDGGFRHRRRSLDLGVGRRIPDL